MAKLKQSKFYPGDEVWTILGSHIRKVKIHSLNIELYFSTHYSDGEVKLTYYIREELKSDAVARAEDKIFKTKEQVIKYLSENAW